MTPRLFVVSAPSGTGKTTIVKRLVKANPGVSLAVSHTTRKPREKERDKRDYYFVSNAEFEEIQAGDGFLEHAEVFGNRYGTSRREVAEKLASGRQVILEIDWQGAEQVRRARARSAGHFPSAAFPRRIGKAIEGPQHRHAGGGGEEVFRSAPRRAEVDRLSLRARQ